jgi:hypothetical protein
MPLVPKADQGRKGAVPPLGKRDDPTNPRELTTGRPRGMSSLAPELRKREIGITPFDCPCDKLGKENRLQVPSPSILPHVLTRRCNTT